VALNSAGKFQAQAHELALMVAGQVRGERRFAAILCVGSPPLHRSGTYSEAEFEQQKSYINQRINEKHLLIQDKRVEEFNMGEALDYCFNFIRDSAKTWKEFEVNHSIRVRFQKRIFTGALEFDGKTYGTPKLSCVYELKQEFDADETALVELVRNAWNDIITELKEWKRFGMDVKLANSIAF
jgi:hypothetical protein